MSNNEFTFGIFAFTKLNSKTCRIGVGLENGNALIEKTQTTETTIIIPAYVKDESTGKLYKVIETNDHSFKNCQSITSITLPDTLIKIGYDSFFQTSIEKLVIPSSVKYLDAACFSNLVKCTQIIFQPGSKIKKLQWAAFSRLDSLTTLILPPSIKEINQSFYDVNTLKSIYYCGTNDLSSENAYWSSDIQVTIYVTSSYQPNQFAGKDVTKSADSVCSPYIYYLTHTCKQINQFYSFHFPISLCYIFLGRY